MILSLTVMVMLLMLALSAAALLTVELRVGRASVSIAQARFNAVAGARIALAEMQRLMGPDTRVSANAATLAMQGRFSQQKRPRLAGAWRGGVVAENYETAHDAAFLGWFNSGTSSAASGAGPFLSSPGAARDTVLKWATSAAADPSLEWNLLPVTRPYAGAAALGDAGETAATLSLYAAPEYFSGDTRDRSTGAFAWAAVDENQKARADLHDLENDGYTDANTRIALASVAARRFHLDHSGENFPAPWSAKLREHTALLGWNYLPMDLNAYGTPWMPRSDGAPALRHDFTLDSLSLLTDTVNGGLKRDVNLLSLVSKEDFTAANFPGIAYRDAGSQGWLGEDPDRQAWKTAKVAADFGGAGNPWDGGGGQNDNARRTFPIWDYVRRWCTFSTGPAIASVANAESVVIDNSGYPFIRLPSATDLEANTNNSINFTTANRSDALYHTPVINRVRIEYTYESVKNGENYDVYPRVNFIVQLWNPYNIRLRCPWGNSRDWYWFRFFNPPMMLKLYVNGAFKTKTSLKVSQIECGMPLFDLTSGPNDLLPGEIRTFSCTAAAGAMTAGYNPRGGVKLNDAAHKITVKPTDEIAYSIEYTDDYGYTYGVNLLGCFELYRGTAVNTMMSNGITTFLGAFGCEVTDPSHNTWVTFASPVSQRTDLGQAQSITPQKNAVLDIRLKSEKTAVNGACLTEIPTMQQMNLIPKKTPTSQARAYNRVAYEWIGWDARTRNHPDDPNDLQVTDQPNHPGQAGFGMTGFTPTTGLLNPIYYQLPLTPPVGLLDLRHARLSGGTRAIPFGPPTTHKQADVATLGYTVHEAFGNSLAHYAVPQNQVGVPTVDTTDFLAGGLRPVDYSWYLNTVLADTWFASSLGDWNDSATNSYTTGKLLAGGKGYPAQLKDFYENRRRLPDRRLVPLGLDPTGTWVSGANSTKIAFKEAGARMAVEGGFNINSTSVRAWRDFLASSHDAGFMKATLTARLTPGQATGALVKALDYPMTEPTPDGADTEERTAGGRVLSDVELDRLAQNMVDEVRKRGPFLSLGEFLNRRVESGVLGRKGALQAAIDATGLNDGLKTSGRALTNLAQLNPAASDTYDYSGVGKPGWVSQADLLAPMATALTARGDTFLVRVAGEAPEGARVVMEMIIQRFPEFLDSADASDTEILKLTKPANKAFGRRFRIVSTRMLGPDAK